MNGNKIQVENDKGIGKLIVDADVGCDDGWALILLLKGEELNKYKLLGITCTSGNSTVDNIVKNTFRILDGMGRTDVPVYKGCTHSIMGKSAFTAFNGKDGLGDLDYTEDINTDLLQKTHAVNAMYQLVCEYPNQITFLLLGPLTNFATCLIMYGTDFAEKLKEIYIMGGNVKGIGNVSKNAEFNFYCDPEAANIVLKKSNCPITIVPWETCLEDKISIKLQWRLNVLGNINNKAIEILNKAEEKCYNNGEYWVPCDAFLASIFLFPDKIIKKESIWHATVELNGKHTRGQMILDHLKKNDKNVNNVKVIDEIYAEYFMKLALWAAGHKNIEIDDINF